MADYIKPSPIEIRSDVIFKGNASIEGDVTVTSDQGTLKINGNVEIDENKEVNVKGDLTIKGKINANTFNAMVTTTSSDARLKKNISPFNCSKSVLDLPIYEFDYINNEKHTIGCLAQDLVEICPELVEEDEQGFLTISETKLIYLLIQEVRKIKYNE